MNDLLPLNRLPLNKAHEIILSSCLTVSIEGIGGKIVIISSCLRAFWRGYNWEVLVYNWKFLVFIVYQKKIYLLNG